MLARSNRVIASEPSQRAREPLGARGAESSSGRVFAELLVERDPIDAEERRGLRSVSSGRAQCRFDRALLQPFERCRELNDIRRSGSRRGAGTGRRPGGCCTHGLGKIARCDVGVVTEDERVLDRVAELADVAWPVE